MFTLINFLTITTLICLAYAWTKRINLKKFYDEYNKRHG